LRAYLKQGLFAPKRVTATVRHEEKAAALAKGLGVNGTTDNRKAVHGADIVASGREAAGGWRRPKGNCARTWQGHADHFGGGFRAHRVHRTARRPPRLP